jgi:hypothetical protein
MAALISGADLHTTSEGSGAAIDETLDQIFAGEPSVTGMRLAEAVKIAWSPIDSTLITRRLERSPLGLFERDEGGQQEHLALWLTDLLDPDGVLLNPLVLSGGRAPRELCDILVNYSEGAFLVESKTLAVFGRPRLPSRSDLAADVDKHLAKAHSQLRGATRALKSGASITDRHHNPVEVRRDRPPTAIILVPDLSLLAGRGAGLCLEMIRSFSQEGNGLLHILDLSALARGSQAASMLARYGQKTSHMAAFDYWLFERWKAVLGAGTIYVDLVLDLRNQVSPTPTHYGASGDD